MNTTRFNTYDTAHKDAERENIDNLLLGGATPHDIMQKYPHFNGEEIKKRIKHIATYCWLSEDERGFYGL